MEIQWTNLARAGYEAYAESTNNKNFRGEEMPAFDELPEAIRQAWIEATRCVCQIYVAACLV